jgi:peptidoglycan/LPS O-acetylase OafA/YrhL
MNYATGARSLVRPATAATDVGAPHWHALDGLRGIAVLMVLADHAGLAGQGRPLGAVGVTVFFVLSGFLISRVVLDARALDRWSLRRFLMDRIVRLVPALLLMQAVVIAWWVLTGYGWRELLPEVAATTLYAQNFFYGDFELGLLRHTWSLAVEEQFYLLWPLVLPWLARRRVPLLWFGCLALTSMLFRLIVAATGAQDLAYASLPANAFALLLGCLLAVDPVDVRGGFGQRVTAWAGLVAILVGAVTASGVPAPYLVLPIPAALLASVVVAASLPGVPLMQARPLRFVGRISYALYLWHWPVLLLTDQQYGGASAIPSLALSLGLAAASTFLVEEPLRRRWRAARTARAVVANG